MANEGLTSDDPITINCPMCNAASTTFSSRSADTAHCYSCNKWLPHTYIKDRWYYSKTTRNTYITKYIGTPNYWEWDTEIKNPASKTNIITTKSSSSPITASKDYPHTCPDCGKPAYVGLFKVDCSAKCR